MLATEPGSVAIPRSRSICARISMPVLRKRTASTAIASGSPGNGSRSDSGSQSHGRLTNTPAQQAAPSR